MNHILDKGGGNDMISEVEKDIFLGKIEKLKEEHKNSHNVSLKSLIKDEISVLLDLVSDQVDS